MNTIRSVSYMIPILVLSVFSITHVITWYTMSNPESWAIYLAIGIEVAALSALVGIMTKMNKYIYVPFFLVTFIQFLGNMFFCYQWIDIQSQLFQDWMEFSGPFFEWINLMEPGDATAHRRFLAFIAGGFIPLISLSFLHLLVSSVDDEDGQKIENDDGGPLEENVEEENKDEEEVEEEPDDSVDDEILHDDTESEEDIVEDVAKMVPIQEKKEDEVKLSGDTTDTIKSGDTKTDEVKEEPEEKPKSKYKKEDLIRNKNRRGNQKSKSNIQWVDNYSKKRTS